ncbi:MAG: stage V sporulation protein S [Clostridia bacterium]|nr:stage V sporulation protein S [Clostridia bacterium]
MNIVKVSGTTVPGDLAGVIVRFIQRDGKMQLRAVGAAAINQTVKAIAISRLNLVSTGADVVCSPWFSEVYIDDKLKTAITFFVELRWPEAEEVSA